MVIVPSMVVRVISVILVLNGFSTIVFAQFSNQNKSQGSLKTNQTLIMKKTKKTLLAHIMVAFGTPNKLGQWKGWNYSNNKKQHNPNRLLANGKRDIASVFYPTIGPYDMTDPHLVEYHCQLMKMSGIDGAIFNLGFIKDPNTSIKKQKYFALKAMYIYNYYFKKYKLKSVINYEDKVHWVWNKKIKNRKDAVKASFSDVEKWLKIFKDSYLEINNQRLICLFNYQLEFNGKGISRLGPQEIKQWLDQFDDKNKPIILSQYYNSDYRKILNGYFEWPSLRQMPLKKMQYSHYNDYELEVSIWKNKESETINNLKYKHCDYIVGGVWPGFNDKECHGWGEGHRLIPRYNGQLYEYHWRRVIKADYPIVQIATWNDWFEGTIVEPSKEYGYQYLEMTRNFASQWKNSKQLKGDLRMPEWIYRLRKRGGTQALISAQKASNELQRNKYQEARKYLTPYIEGLEIADNCIAAYE